MGGNLIMEFINGLIGFLVLFQYLSAIFGGQKDLSAIFCDKRGFIGHFFTKKSIFQIDSLMLSDCQP